MKKVKVDFENCYGIGRMCHEFDFSENNIITLYSPNGSMKTSFANIFKDFSENKDSIDRIHRDRKPRRDIFKDGNSIKVEDIFVIEPFNQSYKSEKVSTLLVDKKLKSKYDEIHKNIDDKKELLVKELKKLSGVKNDIEELVSVDIVKDKKDFYGSISQLEKEVENDQFVNLADIVYSKVFTDKSQALLADFDFKDKLDKYMQTYDKLMSNSTFFKKGVFNHNSADDVAKSIKSTGFFMAQHSVNITVQGQKETISKDEDLEEAIKKEKNTILNDAKLLKAFEKIDEMLKKNQEVKKFRDYLEENTKILPELENAGQFKRRLWIAYLVKNKAIYKDLLSAYKDGKKEIESIVEFAKKEKTKWESVIDTFNKRFEVPFSVIMANQEDVILRSETPSVRFKFKDEKDTSGVDIFEGELWGILSQGERRALYLLNIIFEIEGRKENKQETLFIVDDIADSFDYKNKYAIVEYLSDIAKESYFCQIILTHNYDFFRTINSRLLQKIRNNKLHAIKTNNVIKIEIEKYQYNPFRTWKDNLCNNNEMLIASIPFLRNLADLCGYADSSKKLTSLLHIKTETSNISVNDLCGIIRDILKDKSSIVLDNANMKVVDIIYSEANKICAETSEVMELEKKVVLSIAIRLALEEILIIGINDITFVNAIDKNQTIVLIKEYEKKYPKKKDIINLAERVNLMTPENIHINSFMYEPILDMCNEHLKKLYKDVLSAKAKKQ